MKIIKYGAPWCGQCKATESVLKNAGVNFEDINVEDLSDEEISKKNIRNIPVVEFYNDDGSELLHKHVGLLTSFELTNILDKL